MGNALKNLPRAVELSLVPAPPKRRMSEAEFIAWCDDETHAEWVDGEVILMSPENVLHKDIALFIAHLMGAFIDRHALGKLSGEAVHVRLAALRRRRSPDLFFIAKHRLHIIKPQHIEGPPDLVLEVISPESVARDYRVKYEEYEKAGVREYWIVDPQAQAVEVHRLGRNGKFTPILEKSGKLRSAVLRGFFLKPAWLWRDPLPSWLGLLKELGVR